MTGYWSIYTYEYPQEPFIKGILHAITVTKINAVNMHTNQYFSLFYWQFNLFVVRAFPEKAFHISIGNFRECILPYFIQPIHLWTIFRSTS